MNDATDPFNESLAQLAGLDLTGVAAVRFENLPPMKAGFEVIEVKSRGRETEKGNRLFIDVKTKVIEVMSVADPAYESAEAREKLVGKSYNETFVIDPQDPMTGLGRFKAFLEDAGYEGTLALGELFGGAATGLKFPGQIKHRTNPTNKDNPYVNLNPIKESASGKLVV